MTSRELIRWSRLHERRAHGALWRGGALVIAAVGGALAAWVGTRATVVGASHAWLAGAFAIFAVAFLRVPFLVYWRADAPLLAQLPIPGRALFDAALARCLAAAITVTAAALVGAIPLAVVYTPAIFLRHAALAGALGAAAAFGMPAVVVAAAALLQQNVLVAAARVAGAPVADAQRAAPGNSSAMLGALPGFAATGIFVAVVLASPWLVDRPASAPGAIVVAALAGGCALAIALVRAGVAARMGVILRDVSALDRQRLAALEIRGPTAIERAIATLAGDGALAYTKDARLVRRRYPMAFALGAIAFLALAIAGLAHPDDPTPWLVVPIAGATAYAFALAGRLARPPIELPRLSASLAIAPAAVRRAKLAWLAGWWLIFIAVPGAFAAAMTRDVAAMLALAAATLAVGSRAWLPGRTTSSRAASGSGA